MYNTINREHPKHFLLENVKYFRMDLFQFIVLGTTAIYTAHMLPAYTINCGDVSGMCWRLINSTLNLLH